MKTARGPTRGTKCKGKKMNESKSWTVSLLPHNTESMTGKDEACAADWVFGPSIRLHKDLVKRGVSPFFLSAQIKGNRPLLTPCKPAQIKGKQGSHGGPRVDHKSLRVIQRALQNQHGWEQLQPASSLSGGTIDQYSHSPNAMVNEMQFTSPRTAVSHVSCLLPRCYSQGKK